MRQPEPKVTERPCQGCGKVLRVEPPFHGREAVWACIDCLRDEHEARVAAGRAKRGAP